MFANSMHKALPSQQSLAKFIRGIWFFPSLLTLLLLLLCAFQINGSSIGIYHSLFYGSQPDRNLLANKPLAIRSDEWVVNTQKAIAQKNDDFRPVNQNIGLGENETLLADAPTTDWSTLFKPHNIGFLFLPFDTAFSLRWWIISYFLLISAYFFVLTILPARKVLAIILSIGLLFSPFLQWWYSSGTLGSVYYILFALIAFMKLIHAKTMKQRIGWSLLLAYVGVCFALILYPPFQIPCLLVGIGFGVGYIVDNKYHPHRKVFKQNILFIVGAVVLASVITGVFIYQKRDIATIISNTSYPGHRIVSSGGYSKEQLLSSQLSPIFQDPVKAAAYSRPDINATNQSESSNFILLLPYLVIPAIAISLRRKRKNINYSVLIVIGISLLYCAWLFIPHLSIIGNLTLLNRVPYQRLLIGFGIANFILIILFVKQYFDEKYKFSSTTNAFYAILIFIFILILDFHVAMQFPKFLGFRGSILYALPFPVIIFCLLQKYFRIALLLLTVFTVTSSYGVNPLYKGTTTLTQTPISTAIKQVAGTSTKRWISEEIYLENFASMNGKPSLTGTYLYPQLNIWNQLNQPSKKAVYNRYAHVSFTFDRTEGWNTTPVITGVGDDQFNLRIQPCDPFFKNMNVGFLITSLPFPKGTAPCATLAQKVTYPRISYYIYKLSF